MWFGGILKGTLALAGSDLGADFKSQLQFTDVDLQSCLGELLKFRGIEGRGDMAVAIDATGDSMLALTRTMNGSANLVSRQGALIGINVEQLLRRLERRPLSGGGDFRNGRTTFEKLPWTSRSRRAPRHQNVGLEGSKVGRPAGSASIQHGSSARRRGARVHQRERYTTGVRTAVRGAEYGRPDHAADPQS
jgi:AsmA protein